MNNVKIMFLKVKNGNISKMNNMTEMEIASNELLLNQDVYYNNEENNVYINEEGYKIKY